MKLHEKYSASKKALTEEVNALEIKNSNMAQVQGGVKFFTKMLNDMDEVLPPDLAQEWVLIWFEKFATNSGITLTNMEFSDTTLMENVQSATPAPASAPATKTTTTDKKVVQATPVPAPVPITDSKKANEFENKGVQMTLKLNMNGSYNQLKAFIAEVMKSPVKMKIVEYTSTAAKSDLAINMTVNVYGYIDSKRPVKPWELNLPKGNNEIFMMVGEGNTPLAATKALGAQGKNVTAQQVTPYDFYTVLNPIMDDAPALVFGKYKKSGSEIYGDSSKMIDLDVTLTEKNGVISYKYSSSGNNYPKNGSTEIFTPVSPDQILINVLSKPRVNAEDQAGVNLNISNETSKKVVVKRSGEASRLNLKIIKGAVFLENN
ncbi:MAG: hypothetical protein H7Y41_03170 [Hyphomonadaceae bacterium]|nr:hypothetical protein [Clostridia bacterium]